MSLVWVSSTDPSLLLITRWIPKNPAISFSFYKERFELRHFVSIVSKLEESGVKKRLTSAYHIRANEEIENRP